MGEFDAKRVLEGMPKGEVLTPSEPEYKFHHADGKIQIFSYVKDVQMFPGVGEGSTCQNFVAEVDTEEEANDLLDRIGVPAKYRPPKS